MNRLIQDQIEAIAFQTTKEGKMECGDSYYFASNDDYFICVLADGLGSGKYAHEASSAVIEVVEKYHHENVDSIMKRCNDVLISKRGAAVAVLKVLYKQNEFLYSCVGNIRFFLYSPSGKLTYPLPVTGYLSGKPQKYHTQRFYFEPNSRFLLFSDGFNLHGIKERLKTSIPVEIIANEIKLQYSSVNDDATFIVGNIY